MAQKDAARAQVEALLDWARQWESDPQEGAEEVTFLLRRSARQIALSTELDIPVEAAGDLPAAAVPAEEPRLG